jgi:uncharacterized delta-60 repeat protein
MKTVLLSAYSSRSFFVTLLKRALLLTLAFFAYSYSHATPGQPGTLDLTFAPNSSIGAGKLIESFDVGSDLAYAVAVQPDGKSVLAGLCRSVTTRNDEFCALRLTATGAIDTSFGSNGKVVEALGGTSDEAYAVAIQPDGKIVLGGRCLQSGGTIYNVCTLRLNPDGTRDASFGSNGQFLDSVSRGRDRSYAIAVQPDGKIVLAGSCLVSLSDDFCAWRLTTNGLLDVSFGSGGTAAVDLGSENDIANAAAIQSDGKIVLVGQCRSGLATFCAARLTASGLPDTSFDNDGQVTFDFGTNDSAASAVAMQTDGKIVLAGYCRGVTNNDFCALRLTATGAIDTSFGSNGKVIEAVSAGNDSAAAVALQPDGKIVLAGSCAVPTTPPRVSDDFCLLRLNADGSPDARFGGGGKFTEPISIGGDYLQSIALQPDGKIVVAGYCLSSITPPIYDFCAMRLDTDCTLDFDGDGIANASTDGVFMLRTMLGFSDSTRTSGLAFSPRATRANEPAMSSYRAYCAPAAPPICNGDIDGDGKQTATIDGLIALRAMLGLRDINALNGIAFPANATRNTWPLVRDHLVTQCGMSLPL